MDEENIDDQLPIAPPPDTPQPEALISPADVTENRNASIAKFLYNHNPFYLISCLLVIYGCQSLAISGGSLIEKSITMAGGIAAYTLLMAVVCIAVVRMAKVWDDARSIFIVVVISLVAVTTGYDELCIGDQQTAVAFTAGAAALVLLVVESLLRLCQIRLSFWYRVAFYAHFAVLIGFPLLLGRAVATRNDVLANWGSVLFSIAIAMSILLLIPAMRRGPESVLGNGTPWTWPLYPLSAFTILLVLAGIRSHAIWMSFGFYGVAGNFEPFLLLPMIAAVIVLIAETGLGRGNQSLQRWALCSTPALLLCAITHGGSTWLPIRTDLQYLFGSSLTVAIAVMFAVYAWMSIRGVRYAVIGLPATLLMAGFFAPLPDIGESIGMRSWMFPAAACVIMLAMTLRMKHADWLWAALAGVATATIAMVGNAYGQQDDGLIAASVFAVLAMLVIGAVFKTDLAVLLRYLAAGAMSFAVTVILFRSFESPHSNIVYLTLLIAIVALAYAFLIRRKAWLMVAAAQLILLFAVVSYNGHSSGRLSRINWPITAGLMCLCVGVAITTGKTGMYRRLAERQFNRKPTRFKSGL